MTCAFVLGVFLASVAAAAAPPNDAQIAAIIVTANQVDINAGKLADARATAPDVKAFGHRMIVDHGSVNKSAQALVAKLHLTPQSNPTSQSLKAGGEQNIGKLKELSGAAFDRAYVDHEVTYHQAVLDAMDSTLIPSARNAELKALLVKVRPAFVDHLQHAKDLQASLAKAGG